MSNAMIISCQTSGTTVAPSLVVGKVRNLVGTELVFDPGCPAGKRLPRC